MVASLSSYGASVLGEYAATLGDMGRMRAMLKAARVAFTGAAGMVWCMVIGLVSKGAPYRKSGAKPNAGCW